MRGVGGAAVSAVGSTRTVQGRRSTPVRPAEADPTREWWTTGVRPSPVGDGNGWDGVGRVLAFQDRGWVPVAVRHGWIRPHDTVLGPPDAASGGWVDQAYGLAGWSTASDDLIPGDARDGTARTAGAGRTVGITAPGETTGSGAGELVDGLRGDTPTAGVVLRIGDDHDLSAFLREADRALTTGIFAEHLLRPDVLVGDLCSLGADFAAAGPDHRLWVAADGLVSTSRTGAVLGRIDEPPAIVTDRWRAHNDDGARPCAVGLAAVVAERDRSEALVDRPWLSRYHCVLRAMRRLRRIGVRPVAASGFGRRLDRRIAELQPGPVIDDPAAPILLVTRQAGRNRHWVLAPDADRTQPVAAADAVRLEYLLAFRSRSGVGRMDVRPVVTERPPAASLDELIGRLVAGGIGADWFASLEHGARPLVADRPIFG